MKRITAILITTFLVAAIATYAQDTTKVSQQETEAADERSGPGVGAQDQKIPAQDYRKDMTVIPASDIPAALRSTLQGEQYKGWEDNSTIYRSKNNDSYIVEMRHGNGVKVHRFDQNGNAVKDY